MIVKATVSLLAITWASCAAAQAPPTDTNGPQGAAQQPSTPASDNAAKPGGSDVKNAKLEEIFVTAQRRSERLVDVPISVATVSAADMELVGPTSIENLTKMVPGVYLQRAVYGLSPTVRGIGSTLAASAGEQNVALYVDDIYYPTPTGNVFDLASVESIELLKGPQGTLFGRNATGGAMLLHTLDPGFKLSGRFNASYERFNQVRSSAYVNVPLTDTVAVNASVAYRNSEGYVHDLKTDHITNQGDNYTGRAKLLWKPTDNFSVILTAAHAKFDDPSGSDYRNLEPAPLLVYYGSLYPSMSGIATDRYHSSFDTKQYIKTETDEFSARAKLEFEAGTLSSNTAFLRNKLDARNDLDATYIPQDVALKVNTETFAQEVNFASSPGKPLSYVVGAYYFRNKPEVPTLTQNGTPLFFMHGDGWSMSGYADGAYDFGNKISLIAGLRYNYDQRSAASGYGVNAPAPATRFQEATEKQWTPRVGLRYAVGERANVYATYSQGFKSGAFDVTSPNGPGVKPETVDAFEVGFKSASSDFTFNAAAYYYDYKDTQVNATISGESGRIFTQLFNVPKSRIYGAEADGSLPLGDAFDLRVALAYTHARYIDFPSASAYINDPTNPATLGGLIFANISVDVSGNTMVRAPEFTTSATLSYHTPLGDNNELEIALSPYYSSRVYFTFDNSKSQDPYVTLDGAATLTSGEHMKFSLFGRNLTDKTYAISIGQNALSLASTTFATPRTYGVSFGYTF